MEPSEKTVTSITKIVSDGLKPYIASKFPGWHVHFAAENFGTGRIFFMNETGGMMTTTLMIPLEVSRVNGETEKYRACLRLPMETLLGDVYENVYDKCVQALEGQLVTLVEGLAKKDTIPDPLPDESEEAGHA